jgi:hypothetical protein
MRLNGKVVIGFLSGIVFTLVLTLRQGPIGNMASIAGASIAAMMTEQDYQLELLKACIRQGNAESIEFRKAMKRPIPMPIEEGRVEELAVVMLKLTEGRSDILWGTLMPLMWSGNGFINAESDTHLKDKKKHTWGYPEFQIGTARYVDRYITKKNTFIGLTDKQVSEVLVLNWQYTMELMVAYLKHLDRKYNSDTKKVFTAYVGGESRADSGNLMPCKRVFAIRYFTSTLFSVIAYLKKPVGVSPA